MTPGEPSCLWRTPPEKILSTGGCKHESVGTKATAAVAASVRDPRGKALWKNPISPRPNWKVGISEHRKTAHTEPCTALNTDLRQAERNLRLWAQGLPRSKSGWEYVADAHPMQSPCHMRMGHEVDRVPKVGSWGRAAMLRSRAHGYQHQPAAARTGLAGLTRHRWLRRTKTHHAKGTDGPEIQEWVFLVIAVTGEPHQERDLGECHWDKRALTSLWASRGPDLMTGHESICLRDRAGLQSSRWFRDAAKLRRAGQPSIVVNRRLYYVTRFYNHGNG